MSRITALPSEIISAILAIGDGHLAPNDVLKVARTCKYLYPFALKSLYSYNISQDNSSVLFWAIKNTRLDTAKIALDFGADVNTVNKAPPTAIDGVDKGTPLHYAAAMGYNDMVDLLLERDAKLDAQSKSHCKNYVGLPSSLWYPLHYAIYNGHEETALKIMNMSPPMELENPISTRDPVTILDGAAARGLATVVQRALDMYPDILSKPLARNEESSLARLPLHCTVQCWNSKSVIQHLVAAGCDMEARNAQLMTPIWMACYKANFATAMDLLNQGAQTRSTWTRPPSMSSTPEYPSLLHVSVRGRGHFPDAIPGPCSTRADEQVAFVRALIEGHEHTVPSSILNTALEPYNPPFLRQNRPIFEPVFADPIPALIRLLLEKGADPNSCNGINPRGRRRMSPLATVVTYLLSPFPTINNFSRHRWRPRGRHSAVSLRFGWGDDDDDEFWEESDKEQDIAWDINAGCGVETNPWLCHLEDGLAELYVREGFDCSTQHITTAADAWEVMVDLINSGAKFDTRIESFPNSPLARLVRGATLDLDANHHYSFLSFLSQRLNSTLSSDYLNEMLQHCLRSTGLGKRL